MRLPGGCFATKLIESAAEADSLPSEWGNRLHLAADGGLSGTIAIAVENAEKRLVVRALEATNGNRFQASRLLGITRQGLLNKINRDQIKRK